MFRSMVNSRTHKIYKNTKVKQVFFLLIKQNFNTIANIETSSIYQINDITYKKTDGYAFVCLKVKLAVHLGV